MNTPVRTITAENRAAGVGNAAGIIARLARIGLLAMAPTTRPDRAAPSMA